MEVYKTAAFTTEGRVYIGNMNDQNEIESFTLTVLNPEPFKNDKIYVVIVDNRDTQKGSEITVLSETKIVNESNASTNISDLDINELLEISNNLLKSFIKNRVLH